MLEQLGRFLEFVAAVTGVFFSAFTHDAWAFVRTLTEAPALDAFYVALVALFFAATLLAIAVGAMKSILERSPQPLIDACERLVRIFGHVGAWVIVILIASMVYEVVARYFFAAPTKWAFEVAYMLMGTSFMFGIAFCLQMRRHIRVDFVHGHVSPRWQAIIDLAGYVLLIPMLLWLSAGLWDYFHEAYRVNETSGESAWNPIIWPFKFTFVIGFVLLLLQSLLEVIKCLMVLAGTEARAPISVEGFD